MLQRYIRKSDAASNSTQANQTSLHYSRNGLNAFSALQAVHRSLYEMLDSAWEMPVGASCLSSCLAMRRRSPFVLLPRQTPMWKGNPLGKQPL